MKNIAIIGGGFSGTMLALNLAAKNSGHAIHVVEPRSSLGLGVAYSTDEPGHLLNVAASNMSAWPDRPHDFIGYLIDERPELAEEPLEFFHSFYAPRMSYGRYIQSLVKRPEYSSIMHHRAQALRVGRAGTSLSISLSNQHVLEASAVVLALGLPPSGAIDRIFGWAQPGRYLSQPWDALETSSFLRDIDPRDHILIIGSGLTMVDMLVSLKQRGHQGFVTIVSRHGQVPQVHAPFDKISHFKLKERTPRAWLKFFREYRDNWRAVFDALRPHTPSIWQNFTVAQKTQFLRHLRPWWDSRRHRVAPEINNILKAGLREERYQVHAGRLLKAQTETKGFNLSFAKPDGTVLSLSPQRVINCTGPESQVINFKGSLWTCLLKEGLLRPDPTGMGVLSTSEFQAIPQVGYEPSPLFVLGALRRGTQWESTAVPELRADAVRLAHIL